MHEIWFLFEDGNVGFFFVARFWGLRSLFVVTSRDFFGFNLLSVFGAESLLETPIETDLFLFLLTFSLEFKLMTPFLSLVRDFDLDLHFDFGVLSLGKVFFFNKFKYTGFFSSPPSATPHLMFLVSVYIAEFRDSVYSIRDAFYNIQ